MRAMGVQRRRVTWPWEECGQGRIPGEDSRVWERPKWKGLDKGQDKRWTKKASGAQNLGPRS